MENDLRQIVLSDQLVKELVDTTMFHRESERAGHDKLIVMVFITQLLHGKFLAFLPVDQHLGNGSWKIDPSCTG